MFTVYKHVSILTAMSSIQVYLQQWVLYRCTYSNEFYGYRHLEPGFYFGVVVDVLLDYINHDHTHDRGDQGHGVGVRNVPKEITICLKANIFMDEGTCTGLYKDLPVLSMCSMWRTVGITSTVVCNEYCRFLIKREELIFA